MTYELIITEKPNAAKKIAVALADGMPVTEKTGGVQYYKITRGKKDIVVGCAVGHLYGLAEKDKKGWTYPVFGVEWKPAYEVNKASKHTKRYVTALKKLAKGANEFTIATDFDIEGEVIGVTILNYLCKQKDGNRMKFSTLTKPDLIKAYENKANHIDWGQAKAGLTRHELDWYYGINLSRALTRSVKAAGSFKLLSSGRVQGPALKIVVDREKEISAFIPEPYWQISLNGKAQGEEIIALHEKDKFWDKKESDKVFEKTKGQPAKVADLKRSQFTHSPPHPFDLTTLQTEAYKTLRISPKNTLSIAQDLYTAGLISYPRTSSQQLPPEIDIKKVLSDLSEQEFYRDYCKEILAKGEPKPNNGKKTDPAHPAVYPTGIISGISGDKALLYDLIVRRFLATLAEPATRETMEVKIDINKEVFITKGTRTVERGWHVYYAPHLRLEEETLPAVEIGEDIKEPVVEQLEKQTMPPKRYTPASIIKDLEKRNLGTKATRAQIIDTLFQRGYVYDEPITATPLGILMVDILHKYAPTILDEELTRYFEEEMEEIRKGKTDGPKVLGEAQDVLKKILSVFKKKEKKIGEELITATRKAEAEMYYLGVCPTCGGDLQIKRGRFGRFVGCTKYPECTQTYKLPANALVKPAKKNCEVCNTPVVMVLKKRKKPQFLCLNADCSSKIESDEVAKEEEEIQNGTLKKICPECQGNMILRKSVYGPFLGCEKFPKCKHTEKLG